MLQEEMHHVGVVAFYGEVEWGLAVLVEGVDVGGVARDQEGGEGAASAAGRPVERGLLVAAGGVNELGGWGLGGCGGEDLLGPGGHVEEGGGVEAGDGGGEVFVANLE